MHAYGEDGDEWQDWVVDKEMDQELKFAQKEEMEQRKDLLKDSIKILNQEKKKYYIQEDCPTTFNFRRLK